MKADITRSEERVRTIGVKSRIYLDYNATAPLRPGVFEAIQPYLTSFYGNPSSIHDHGRHARNGIEESRGRIAEWLDARRDQFIFKGGGSESINLAIKGAAMALRKKGNHIIT